MTATLGQGRDFTAITITDRNGATLTMERTDDGRMSAWIAAPGFNDGHSVLLNPEDAVAVSAYLTGRDVELLPHLVAARKLAAVYADKVGQLTAELARVRAENTARDAVVETVQS